MSFELSKTGRFSATRLVLALAALSFAFAASAADQVNVSSGLTLAGGPLAIRGYDAVAYIHDNQAVHGHAEHSVLHDGAVYRFATAKNKKAFEKNPQRFLPAYGGFCAYGVAVGAKFDGDPEVFRVVDGRLYLNLNPGIQSKWEEDVKGNIHKADGNWRKIHDTPIADLK
ncbi:MAG: YHS domain-containing (seleno)protein [Acidobacteriota bacterium]